MPGSGRKITYKSRSYTCDRVVEHVVGDGDAIKVYTEGYGDYEWLRSVYRWTNWIEEQLSVDRNDFDLYSNALLNGDEAWLSFKKPEHLTLFLLKTSKDMLVR